MRRFLLPNGTLVARLAAFLFLLLGVCLGTARAADAGPPGDAGDAASEVAPDEAALVLKTGQVRALLGRSLELTIQPRSLFDVALDDTRAVAVETARLSAMLREVEETALPVRPKKPAPKVATKDAGLDAGLVPEALLRARVDLDRARLEVYLLPLSARTELLQAHEERQKVAAAARVETDAERRERESLEARQNALIAARNAQTESARLLSEEYARLLGVEQAQSAFGNDLAERAKQMSARRELSLKLQRRVRELRESSDAKAGSSAADALYEELRQTLRASRDRLAEALAASPGTAPLAGPDPLDAMHLTSDQIRGQRAKLGVEAERLAQEDERLREQNLRELLDETTALNRDRLSLMPFLNKATRDAVVGFGEEGQAQAAAEVRQLSLLLLYHKRAAVESIRSFRQPGKGLGFVGVRGALVAAEWMALVAAFLWWRKRAQTMLEAWRERVRDADRLARSPKPSPVIAAITFALPIRASLEWLLLTRTLEYLLPESVSANLEVSLVFVVLTWTFAGRVVVDLIDSLAAGGTLDRLTPLTAGTPGLRHRSLRLVGRVVVLVGVSLVVSSRLVGRGAIYSWVLSGFWTASVPVFLVLIRWWRGTVFARLARVRKPSTFERWVLAHKSGWASFFAASAGAIYLFANGTFRAVRSWVAKFEISRKAMAYLFRRRLDRLGAEGDALPLDPLAEPVFASLGPAESPADVWIQAGAHEALAALAARVKDRRGGLVAVVGERGLGKTASLRRIAAQTSDVVFLDVPSEGVGALRQTLAERLGLSHDVTTAETFAALAGANPTAVILDNFHRFAQPTMGGLRAFDEVLAHASRHADQVTWIFSFDRVMWQFLERARAARPAFDEVLVLDRWHEDEIGALLRARSEHAGLDPSFERLLERLPANADEIDRQEALTARAASYYRLLWDHASGNPGVALHMWRRSLGTADSGTIFVRAFQSLDLRDLEQLPDAAVFVLKAVLQLAPASPDMIAKATMLRPAQVNDALRYALARGYVEQSSGRYLVTWTWFRATTLFLQRRHLLVSA